MKTYQLGTCGDRILTVKKSGGEHIVTIKVKDSDTKCIELPPKRWAAFRQVVDDTDKSVRAILSGDQNVKFLHHIGGAYYVTVNSGYRCVNLRKWFQPLDSAGDIKPTKKGVSLRLDEWSSLCNLVDVINKTFTSLDSAQPCYYGDDHMNQPGWLNCTECHPFYVSLSQSAANGVA